MFIIQRIEKIKFEQFYENILNNEIAFYILYVRILIIDLNQIHNDRRVRVDIIVVEIDKKFENSKIRKKYSKNKMIVRNFLITN